jgi:hypothetical protein
MCEECTSNASRFKAEEAEVGAQSGKRKAKDLTQSTQRKGGGHREKRERSFGRLEAKAPASG